MILLKSYLTSPPIRRIKTIKKYMSTKLTAQQRKERPIYSGFIKYFPLAIREVSNISFVSNEQHNPGTEMHWDRTKSKDELDALMRHLADYSRGIEYDDDGQPHLGKVAWRAMAMFEKWLEEKEICQEIDIINKRLNQGDIIKIPELLK